MEISLGSEAGPCSASMRVLWEQDQTQPGFPNLPALYSPLQCPFSKPIPVTSSLLSPCAGSMSPIFGCHSFLCLSLYLPESRAAICSLVLWLEG